MIAAASARALLEAIGPRLAELPEGRWAALLIANLRDLHAINASYGFDAGDALLEATAERLDAHCRTPAWWSYRGQGQFVILLPGLAAPGLAELAGQRLAGHLSSPLEWGSQTLVPHITLGMATGDHTTAPGTLLLDAEQALGHARERGLRQWLYDAATAATRPDLELRTAFLAALENNALEFHYQPKCRLADGTADSAEALLRWRHPEQGWISPEWLVAIAEHSGQGGNLLRWALHTALRESREWPLPAGHRKVAVNLSAQLVDSPELVPLVHQALEIWGTRPGELTLEVTESAVIQDKSSGFDNLNTLRASGVHIAIDDFGTGYSSLSYFRDMPADELKIDKSFVMPWQTDPGSRRIVQLVVDMAGTFELEVVAEGIEDEATLAALAAMGCHHGQGYAISRPLPQADFCRWLEHRNGLS